MERPVAESRIQAAAAIVSTTMKQTGIGTPSGFIWARWKPAGSLLIQAPPVTLIRPPFRMREEAEADDDRGDAQIGDHRAHQRGEGDGERGPG